MKKKIQIIFDFDGVILNSHKIKTNAFYNIFKKFGHKIAIKSQNYHEKNIGISRFKKFKFITKTLLNHKDISLSELDKNFKGYCMNKILSLDLNKNLLKFFKEKHRGYELYVSTGTPQNEIIQILKKKKIFKYFKKVYGSPDTKINHINKIKKKNQIRIFIGDSKEDYIASKRTNTLFILKEHNENINTFKKLNLTKIKNYINLEKNILSLI